MFTATRFGAAPTVTLDELIGTRPLRDADGRPQRAECRDDPDLWFSSNPAKQQQAKDICAACPLRADCLQVSIEQQEPYGVWGGEATRAARGRPSNGTEALRKKLYDDGATDREIADAANVTVQAVKSWRRRNDLPNNESSVAPGPLSIEEETRRRQLHALGWNDGEIAREVGCAAGSVYDWRRRRDLPANQRPGDPSTGRIAS